jgi:hypothetical protein
MSFQKMEIFYILLTGETAPPHPPFITFVLSPERIGSPQPPRIIRRLVRLLRFLCCRVLRFLLRVEEKGFKEEKNLVNLIILYYNILL